jgi:hypothetical protein
MVYGSRWVPGQGHPEGVGAWNDLKMVRMLVPVHEMVTEYTVVTVTCSACGWSRERSVNLMW